MYSGKVEAKLPYFTAQLLMISIYGGYQLKTHYAKKSVNLSNWTETGKPEDVQ